MGCAKYDVYFETTRSTRHWPWPRERANWIMANLLVEAVGACAWTSSPHFHTLSGAETRLNCRYYMYAGQVGQRGGHRADRGASTRRKGRAEGRKKNHDRSYHLRSCPPRGLRPQSRAQGHDEHRVMQWSKHGAMHGTCMGQPKKGELSIFGDSGSHFGTRTRHGATTETGYQCI